MDYAKVANGVVTAVYRDPDPSTLGAGLREQLIVCPAEVEKGWHFDGNLFTDLTPEEKAAKAKREEDADRRTRFLDIMDKLMDTLESKGVLTQAEIDAIWEAGT